MNQKGESPVEIISLIAMGAFMIVPFFIIGLPWWGIMFSIIAVVVLLTELISQLTMKKTISRQFWEWSVKTDENGKKINVWKAILVLCSMQLGWFMLLFHLAIKMLHS